MLVTVQLYAVKFYLLLAKHVLMVTNSIMSLTSAFQNSLVMVVYAKANI